MKAAAYSSRPNGQDTFLATLFSERAVTPGLPGVVSQVFIRLNKSFNLISIEDFIESVCGLAGEGRKGIAKEKQQRIFKSIWTS